MESKANDPINTLPVDVETSLPGEDFKGILDETAHKMKFLKDQLQLRLHLASMEAYDLRHDLLDSVEHLGTRVHELSKSFDRTLDKSQVQLHLGLMEVKERWDITMEEAQKALSALKEDQGKALQMFQEVRLQAKLAQVETKEFIEDSQKELAKKKTEVTDHISHAIKRINGSVSDFLHQLT